MVEDEPLMSARPKTCHEKLLWERLRTEELTKEVKSLRHEVGVLTSELDELRYLMKTEEVGALILKNKTNIEKNINLEAKNKRLKEEYDRMFSELIKLKNR